MARPLWNWQRADWPRWRCDSALLEPLEAAFLRRAGEFQGSLRHVGGAEQQELVVEIISEEALRTSEIEGELLNRESLQSSLRRNFGLTADHRRVPPAEQGISQMMADLHRQCAAPLCDALLGDWHRLLMNGRRDLKDVGRYRTHATPMQVVSGPIHDPVIHFEAPPSSVVPHEMTAFITWYARTRPDGAAPLPILTRAGMAHLHFVSIHPFEDGNGRIGRALAGKVVCEGLARAALLALSQTISSRRGDYYAMLEQNNKHCEITPWLVYFANTILEAQAQTQRLVDFIIAKTKFHDRLRGQLNERQQKVIARMLREGPAGFAGGMSTGKYISLTGASRATATRDLQDLVSKAALLQSGSLKSTRYHLRLALEA